MRKWIRRLAVLLFWLAAWYGICMVVQNSILMATPAETAGSFLGLLGRASFYVAVGRSLLRIGAGFALGAGTAVLLAAGSVRFPLLEELLAPAIRLVKAVPVASFVVLLLIWWGPSFLALAVCFLVVLPNLYISTLEGLKSRDRSLLEMAQVFRLPLWNRFFYLYRPALRPFLYSSLKVSLGMCWKSGVAAEMIGISGNSIGEQLYLSKIYLDTAGLFAWTAVVLLLSCFFEKIVLRLADAFFSWEPGCRKRRPMEGGAEPASMTLEDVTKSYGGKLVLNHISRVYRAGEVYLLDSPSGSGKTTLLRVLAGLTLPDSGSVKGRGVCSMAFQEDRLCEDYSAVKNIELVTGDRSKAESALRMLLEEDALDKPCRQLSGGMRRRVVLVRAMEAESACVFLDEPFTGMDAGTRQLAEDYIRERQKGRLLVIASHI